MDMYVKMYDELRRGKDDNPTIGIVLCSETDEIEDTLGIGGTDLGGLNTITVFPRKVEGI